MNAATTQVAYDLSNFPALNPVVEKATEILNRPKGGGIKFKSHLHKLAVLGGNLTTDCQVNKPDGGSALRTFTLGELADSAKHEVTPQSVDPKAVSDILFGTYGLIRKSGGGRAERLMEDIEVAFIKDLVLGTTVGPIITSGRHRTLALQVMIKAAGIASYQDFSVRCAVIILPTQAAVQDRIISANIGSRDFSRSEIRERVGSASGLVLNSRSSIDITILQAKSNNDVKAAFSAYVKLIAADLGLATFTPAQFSDAGNSLWNALEKERPEGGTFSRWIRADLDGRFSKVMAAVNQSLPTASSQALHDSRLGSKAGKVAKALAPLVAAQCF